MFISVFIFVFLSLFLNAPSKAPPCQRFFRVGGAPF